MTGDARSRWLVLVRRQAFQRLSMIGLFNAQSVANKSASISAWISDQKLTIVGLMETWHDAADRPSLIACAPPGYHYIKKARLRDVTASVSAYTNHGGVCLLFNRCLRARQVQLLTCSTFESVGVRVQRSGFNAHVVCIHRPSSQSVTDVFFTNLSDLFERIAIFASPVIVMI